VNIKQTKGIKCTGCGGRIPASESDIFLRKLDSEKLSFYHERCAGKMQAYMLANPTVWRITHRHIDEGMN
jgi:hypothetical protein